MDARDEAVRNAALEQAAKVVERAASSKTHTFAAEVARMIRALSPARVAEGDPIQRLWCEAIVATQDESSGRMVCDVEKLLHYVNSRKAPESPAKEQPIKMRLIKQETLQELMRMWRAGEPYPEDTVGSEGNAVAAWSEPYPHPAKEQPGEQNVERDDDEAIYLMARAALQAFPKIGYLEGAIKLVRVILKAQKNLPPPPERP